MLADNIYHKKLVSIPQSIHMLSSDCSVQQFF